MGGGGGGGRKEVDFGWKSVKRFRVGVNPNNNMCKSFPHYYVVCSFQHVTGTSLEIISRNCSESRQGERLIGWPKKICVPYQ